VDICLSGKEAIELVKQRDYDLIFMDHMMPDMDGIEATAHIRAWEKEKEKISNCEPSVRRKQVPIVALTANAVVGMREMFIEKDFNDFLAKPIDVPKLEEILGRWVKKGTEGTGEEEEGTRGLNSESSDASGPSPDSSNNDPQSPQSPSSPHSPLPGVDMERGLKTIGGNMEVYGQILRLFCEDAEERLPVLQSVPEAAGLLGMTTQLHALKSASASIGAAEVSALALKLETAGKAGDMTFIQENLSGFAEQLAELVKNIRAWEKSNAGK
jgi:CheY-like chemotaxis protein